MVEIAKALSFESTKVLIMDEPTSALSAAETEVLFTLIRDLQGRGVGVVYISHRMEELRAIADRVTVLRDGKYIGTRTMAEVDEREIIAMMVGRDLTGHTRPEGRRHASRTEPSLEVSGLSTKRLLRDISFSVYPGEILGFAGLMGAGRTEVARAVIGADPKQSGVIEVGGREVTIHHPADAVKYGVGYLSEDRKRHGLMLERHVDFNILLAAMQRFTKWGVVQTKPGRGVSRDYVKKLRIKTPNISTPVKNLSGGNQQKVVVAKWLARNCDVLIFDEPTRGIDVGAKEEIYQLLNDLITDGKSVIVISSDLAEVLRVCDRILVMSQGRITGELTNAEADQENIMELATKSMRQEAYS
jgi:ribose transport system ATP-binding protein